MATPEIDDDPLAAIGNLFVDSEGADPNDRSSMTLIEHLEELRKRIFASLVAIVLFGIVAFFFRDPLMDFLTWPLPAAANVLGTNGAKLTVTGIGEGFTTELLIATGAGFVAALPIILYQTWAFISPGLYQHEKKHAVPFIGAGLLLFLAGITVGYLVLQYPVSFLVTFASENFVEMISAGSYFKFVGFFLLAFGIVFEIPLILTFLSIAGLVTVDMLKKKRSVVHVSLWIASTLLMPGGDIYSPIIMGVVMSALYEASIATIIVVQHFRARAERKKQAEADIEEA